jgi:hypothetical protein
MARTYFVDSEAVIVSPSWSISDKINSRSTLSVTVLDKQSAIISEGAEFKMFNGAIKIFEGVILRIRKYESDPNVLYYNLDIVDNSALADRRVIAKTYVNQTAGYIVTDLITEVLGEESITAGTIATGPIIKKAVFNYIKCSSALDYIKKVTGLNWNIDKYKQLQFFDRSTNISPFTLNSTIQHNKFQQESNMDEYRNIQYVRGGRGRTAIQENEVLSPAPDGKSRSFIARFPLAEQPIIEINVNGSGWIAIDSAEIGINGLNNNKKWYWTYGSQIITQDNTETVLSTVDAIRLTYIGLRNLFVKIENPSEITTQGKYEALNTEKSINITEQAVEYANGLIETYGEIKDTISFTTEVEGLQAGQLLPVQKTLYGINDSFLIESVSIKPSDSGSIEYVIKGLDGAAIGGWEEFFKELLKGNRDYAINENEVLILLNLQQENDGYQGELNLYITTRIPNIPLLPSPTLRPRATLYPSPSSKMIFDSEVDLSD